jgi:hypothetical protein
MPLRRMAQRRSGAEAFPKLSTELKAISPRGNGAQVGLAQD